MIIRQSCIFLQRQALTVHAITLRQCVSRLKYVAARLAASPLGFSLMCWFVAACAASADTSVRLWRAPGAGDGALAATAYGAEEVAVLEVGCVCL